MHGFQRVLLVAAALVTFGCQQAATPPAPIEKRAPPVPQVMTITAKTPDAVAAVKTGMDYADNVRAADATEQFNKALAADPDCAIAHALLGASTPGTEGMTHLSHAEELAASLPPAEKAYIQSMAAERRGESDKALDLLKTASGAAHDDWHLQFALGQMLWGRYQLADAQGAFESAGKLNAKAGPVWNSLGYVDLGQGKTDEAVTAFQKYADLTPNEANPQDSLAEALMAAGRYDEAIATYQKALSMNAAFWPSWGGIAQANAFKGDWKGAQDALAKEKDAATRPQDKHQADIDLAWTQLASGKPADAMKTLDAAEAMAKEQKLEVAYAFAPVERAHMLVVTGKAAQAIPLTDEAIKRATDANLPGEPAGAVLRDALATRIDAEAKLGKADDAKTTLGKLETEIARSTGNRRYESILAFARGEAAMAAKDSKAAAEQFGQCIPDDSYCRLEHARALKASGDQAGAAAVASALMSLHRRDAINLWIEAQAKPLGATAAAKAGSTG